MSAKEHGFKLADLVEDEKPGKSRKTGSGEASRPVKYRNPDDLQQFWSRIRRRPACVRQALDAGRNLDELAA